MWQAHESACVAALVSASRDYANFVRTGLAWWLLVDAHQSTSLEELWPARPTTHNVREESEVEKLAMSPSAKLTLSSSVVSTRKVAMVAVCFLR
ncbi:hypothetical protein [Burkholderia anthina]|uniref:hypothetical protein n=1 Tax=Burkholderia anthina TaxID=179879 RepID=UPI001588B802|nr:hypothetical protein [Burkholderia anthina]